MDYVATAIGLISCWMVGRGNKWGWLLWVVGSIIFGYMTYNAKLYGLTLGSIMYAILELRGFYLAHENTVEKRTETRRT